jgi:hypothetical protein
MEKIKELTNKEKLIDFILNNFDFDSLILDKDWTLDYKSTIQKAKELLIHCYDVKENDAFYYYKGLCAEKKDGNLGLFYVLADSYAEIKDFIKD